jgi:hypothetical protein
MYCDYLGIMIMRVERMLFLVTPNIYHFGLVGHYSDVSSYRVDAWVDELQNG